MNDGAEFFEFVVAHPRTVEEMLLAIGMREEGEIAEIVMTNELVADLCTRLVRLEDWRESDDESETEG